MKLDIATAADAAQISDLLNLAYRGSEGWTTENSLVEGRRCNVTDVLADINATDSYLLVYKDDDIVQACILVQKNHDKAYIGSFAVKPGLQNLGIGKAVLNLAEQYAVTKFLPNEYVMVVLSSRAELIEYYERRGYQRNGKIKEYPVHLNVGVPFTSGLTIEELVKKA